MDRIAIDEPTLRGEDGTLAVLERHLAAFAAGIDAVLADYAEHSVLITPNATYHGLGAIRAFFTQFFEVATPEFWSAFRVTVKSVHGKVAFLAWTAPPLFPSAVDTLLIEDDCILVQTFVG